jgi:hypothetical protein
MVAAYEHTVAKGDVAFWRERRTLFDTCVSDAICAQMAPAVNL